MLSCGVNASARTSSSQHTVTTSPEEGSHNLRRSTLPRHFSRSLAAARSEGSCLWPWTCQASARQVQQSILHANLATAGLPFDDTVVTHRLVCICAFSERCDWDWHVCTAHDAHQQLQHKSRTVASLCTTAGHETQMVAPCTYYLNETVPGGRAGATIVTDRGRAVVLASRQWQPRPGQFYPGVHQAKKWIFRASKLSAVYIEPTWLRGCMLQRLSHTQPCAHG